MSTTSLPLWDDGRNESFIGYEVPYGFLKQRFRAYGNSVRAYSKQVPSDLYTYTPGSAQIPVLTRPTGYSDQVVCPLNNKGDMVRPTKWNYFIERNQYFHGIHKVYNSAGGNQVKRTGNIGPNVLHVSRDNRDAVYAQALEKLNSKVRGNLDLSVALGEANTTARMIKSTLKVLNHARRLKPPGGFGSTRDLANGYLQFKYGWKPLMSDVFDVANESLRIVINRLQTISAKARISEVRREKVIYPAFGSVANVPVDRVRKPGSFSGCRIGVALEIPTSSFRLDRWTSMNPLSITWELMPYSFVVDWFVDVGSYLRNVETACLYNLAFRYGYVSEIWKASVEDTVPYYKTPPVFGAYHEIMDAAGEAEIIIFDRAVLASYPFPRRPSIKVDLSSSQLWSAASLLRQLLPDKGQPQPPPRSRGGGTIKR